MRSESAWLPEPTTDVGSEQAGYGTAALELLAASG